MKLLLLVLLINNLFAVGEAGAIFLLISPGAGPQGSGEAQVARVNDAYASYYNPSGLAFLKGREAVGMHVQWLPNLADDLYYEFLAYRHYIEGLGSVGGHIISDMELARMTEEEKDKAYREEGLGDTFEFDKNCRAMSRYHNHRMGVLRLS